MKCSKCGYEESKVVDSRPADDCTSVRRRRECIKCKNRFTTYERKIDNTLVVVKKDGSSEAFNREKLERGLLIAFTKRPVPHEKIQESINRIQYQVSNMPNNQISSTELGEIVLENIAPLDEVAYIRFASVYRDFNDVKAFSAALNRLNIK
ncbi:MAG: transcriptional repressor NrdR [Eggerthellaceae bacterium]|nr:transcriptional repressor NrdR [Eggerthellaceae bacterium]